jgi:hypothetical protein
MAEKVSRPSSEALTDEFFGVAVVRAKDHLGAAGVLYPSESEIQRNVERRVLSQAQMAIIDGFEIARARRAVVELARQHRLSDLIARAVRPSPAYYRGSSRESRPGGSRAVRRVSSRSAGGGDSDPEPPPSVRAAACVAGLLLDRARAVA